VCNIRDAASQMAAVAAPQPSSSTGAASAAACAHSASASDSEGSGRVAVGDARPELPPGKRLRAEHDQWQTAGAAHRPPEPQPQPQPVTAATNSMAEGRSAAMPEIWLRPQGRRLRLARLVSVLEDIEQVRGRSRRSNLRSSLLQASFVCPAFAWPAAATRIPFCLDV
jgi:hypothetical protein